eukprot:24649-Rhodomonas_salina.1
MNHTQCIEPEPRTVFEPYMVSSRQVAVVAGSGGSGAAAAAAAAPGTGAAARRHVPHPQAI